MYFFSGSSVAKLDEKNRFVLPQSMRYGLVENGQCEFSICLGVRGCLHIYRKGVIESMVEQFKKQQHVAKYQKFFTLFFSTMHHTTCDKIGRVSIPSSLRNIIGIDKQIVVAGVLDKIELWPEHIYRENMNKYQSEEIEHSAFQNMVQEAFELLNEPKTPLEKLDISHIEKAQDLIKQ